MGKLKMPKGSPTTDMTPLVDLGFLLVTFFMLSAKFRTAEPITTDPPYSTSTEQMPEKVMLITIDKEGRVYYDLSGKDVRQLLLSGMAERYESLKTLTKEQQDEFLGLGSMGMPIAMLPNYLKADQKQREAMDKETKGIPLDSLNNELGDWIQEGFEAFMVDVQEKGWDLKKIREEGLRYAIKADADTDYGKVEKVIDVFRDKNIFQFNMVTNMEKADAVATTGSTE